MLNGLQGAWLQAYHVLVPVPNGVLHNCERMHRVAIVVEAPGPIHSFHLILQQKFVYCAQCQADMLCSSNMQIEAICRMLAEIYAALPSKLQQSLQ